MKFKLYTLIDITETGARRGEDPLKVRQQQNFLTVVQTIGIRANPEISQAPVIEKLNLSKLDFGTDFKGTKLVWSLEFSFGLNHYHTLEQLVNDFDFVPIIGELTENIKPTNWVFRTTDDAQRNIFFVKD